MDFISNLFLEPNLDEPGVKPVGQVELSEYAKQSDIRGLWFNGLEAVTGQSPTAGNGTATVDAFGGIFDSFRWPTADSWSRAYDYPSLQPANSATVVSLIYTGTVSAQNSRIYHAADAVTAPYEGLTMMVRSTGKLYSVAGPDANNLLSTTVLSSNTFYWVSHSWDGTTQTQVIADFSGSLIERITNSKSGSITYNAASIPVIGGYYNGGLQAQTYAGFAQPFLSVFGKGLSDNEVIGIFKDAYAILVQPSGSVALPIPVAAGGANPWYYYAQH